MLVTTALVSLPAVDLLRLDGCPPGAELPPGWRLRPVSGVPSPDFSVDQRGEDRALRIGGRGAAAWAYNELDTPLTGEAGLLRWSWRAPEAPAGADLGRPAGDDAPLRIYVVFGKPSLFGRARAIFYSWDGGEGGATRSAFESDRIAVVPLAAGGGPRDAWRAETVRPFRDYRRFWPGEPPPIRVVGVMQDTDDTGSPATGELRALVWEPQPGPALGG